MARILEIGTSLPSHVYQQAEVTAMLASRLAGSDSARAVLQRIHQSTQVKQRHFALPIEMYGQLDSFTESNALFSEHALALAERATSNALDASGISAHEVDHIFFTTVTGIGAPSLDALLVQRMGFRADVRRTPSFGLGCVAGAAGIARVADYLKGHPKDVALVISVELCSLTVQWDDRSMANYIGTGLFGDGAATVVMVGEQHNSALDGIRVLGSRSVLYPETQDLIGWKIGTTGFSLMLEAGVPDMIAKHFAEDVDAFLAFNSMTRADVDFWIAHPGGPKILDAFRDSLSLGPVDLDSSWGVLGSTGNMSSAAVLHVLSGVRHQAKGATGLLFAFGPGVSAELVLLEWS